MDKKIIEAAEAASAEAERTGVPITPDQVERILAGNGELQDTELDGVAGGGEHYDGEDSSLTWYCWTCHGRHGLTYRVADNLWHCNNCNGTDYSFVKWFWQE